MARYMPLLAITLLLIACRVCRRCASPYRRLRQPSIVLHAARLLDVENGNIVTPGEILVQGQHIVEVGSTVKHPPALR